LGDADKGALMKTTAAVLYEVGLDAPYAQSQPLRVEELTLEGPGPGEVLVEMAAAGLCHSDLSVINGARVRPMPMVLGHEGAGVVRELGAGVKHLQVCDHVVFSFVPVCGECLMCQTGRAALCEPGNAANAAGQLLSGTRRFTKGRQQLNHHLGVSAFSQFTVAAANSLVSIDRNVPLEVAVLFGCAIMTGVGAVINTAHVPPGASVAVFGMGGVGLSAVMGAKASGAATIIAIDTKPNKLELALQAGATHTVNADEVDVQQTVRNLSGGGAQFVFEAVGNEHVLALAYAVTARGGTTVTIGLPHPSKMLSIPAISLVAEERRLVGSYMGSCVPRRDLPRLLRMYQSGSLPVELLTSRYIELGQINEAFDALNTGDVARQVLRFG
jgi:alcohol dehydrogenase